MIQEKLHYIVTTISGGQMEGRPPQHAGHVNIYVSSLKQKLHTFHLVAEYSPVERGLTIDISPVHLYTWKREQITHAFRHTSGCSPGKWSFSILVTCIDIRPCRNKKLQHLYITIHGSTYSYILILRRSDLHVCQLLSCLQALL